MARERENLVKSIALETGFSLAGIAAAEVPRRAGLVFDRWLGSGNHAEMTYLERHREKRQNPSLLLDGARSIVSVALNYYLDNQERPEPGGAGEEARGKFSIYALGRDYHDVLGNKLELLRARLAEVYPGMRAVACADTKPLSDRTSALMAGIGWLGKNTSVISPRYGSWIFLGELITDLELEPDHPLETMCGDCRLCLDACPTGALAEPFLLDSRKCISYLTVEKRGEIRPDLCEKIGDRLFGCDTCQVVCPFNDCARESEVFYRAGGSPLVDKTAGELENISDGQFHEMAANSAIRRCRADGLRRNAGIVRRNATRRKDGWEEKPKK
jgi:epoxyqueuosine reductase